MAAKTGGWFTSLITTVKVWVALRLGVPLSLTVTVMRLVLGPWSSVGVQMRWLLVVSMLMPEGKGEIKAKVNTCGGRSGSVATRGISRVVSSFVFWSGMGSKMGARFTSLTTTVKLVVALPPALSVTLTPTRYVLGPCASVGVQVMRPVFWSMFATLMPSGTGATKLNTRG